MSFSFSGARSSWPRRLPLLERWRCEPFFRAAASVSSSLIRSEVGTFASMPRPRDLSFRPLADRLLWLRARLRLLFLLRLLLRLRLLVTRLLLLFRSLLLFRVLLRLRSFSLTPRRE